MFFCSNRFRHASHLNSEPGRNFVFIWYMNYTKNAFGYTQILTQLKERGLLFKDEEQAIKEFPDTYFEDAVYIYYFDKK